MCTRQCLTDVHGPVVVNGPIHGSAERYTPGNNLFSLFQINPPIALTGGFEINFNVVKVPNVITSWI